MTTYEWITTFLVPITGIVSWIAGSRMRRNDTLKAMQTTVDLLVQKNRELYEELLRLRQENDMLRDQGIKRDNEIETLKNEIERLKKLYPQIEILLGVEANIVENENCLDVTKDEAKEYDFINAGYHYGVTKGYCISNWLYDHGIFKTEKRRKKLVERNTKMTVGAIKNNKIKILTHPGDKAPVDMDAVAKACAEEGVLMEISTHHSHLTVEEIKTAAKYDVSFVISSDAHNPERVGDFEGGIERAIEAGLDLSRIVNIEVIE